MKKIILHLALLLSSNSALFAKEVLLTCPVSGNIAIFVEETAVTCPCVDSKIRGACCCTNNNNSCNCVENFEKNGSVPVTCTCPKKSRYTMQTTIPYIEISYGDLFDKLTILELKNQKINDGKKLVNIYNECTALQKVFNIIVEHNPSKKELLLSLKRELTSINVDLWRVEDALQEKESTQVFDAEFISLARNVYKLNHMRAAIKRKISTTLGSHFIEEKSYPTSAE